MAARLRRARWLVYIYFRCLGQQMKAILAYESDFVILMISAGLVQITGLLFIWTVFLRIPDINGWTFWQVVMMYSLIFITEGVGSLFFEGTWRVSRLVYLGNFVTGGALMAISLGNVHVQWTPGRLLMLVILIISAATIRVAINLATSASAFWIRTPWSMVPMFVHQLGEFAKYPITIYSMAVQAVVVVAIPFAFVSFFPTAYLFNIESWSAIGLLTPLVAVYCMFMAVWIFQVGLRRYESTGH